MRVLWIVNIIMPEIANDLKFEKFPSGGWLVDLSRKIVDSGNVELAILTVGNVEKFINKKVNNINYYIIPGSVKNMLKVNKKIKSHFSLVFNDFKPEIIHLHGTEFNVGLEFINMYPQALSLLTIQGIIKRIGETFCDGIPIKEKIASPRAYMAYINPMRIYKKQSKYEKQIISKIKYATGRTDWDKSFMQSINEDLKYYRLNYNLRPGFYSAEKWKLENCNRYTIYCTGKGTALKGFHIVIKALAEVKKKYPGVLVSVAGPSVFESKSRYAKYLGKLIDEYDLRDNVQFIGSLNEKSVIDIMKKSHVSLISSAMENASATLCEAQYLGVPVVAAYRGGMTELFEHGRSGFFYDYPEHNLAAQYITELFENNDKCVIFSQEGIKIASNRHEREKNASELITVYKEINTEVNNG